MAKAPANTAAQRVRKKVRKNVAGVIGQVTAVALLPKTALRWRVGLGENTMFPFCTRPTGDRTHEPPVSLVTKLAESGIHWDKGAQVPLFDPSTQGLSLVDLDDEVNLEIDSFNRTVISENFYRVV